MGHSAAQTNMKSQGSLEKQSKHRVCTGQGNLEIIKIMSRSENCQEILKIQEKVNENWKNP